MALIIRDGVAADILAVFAIRTSVRENHLSVEDLARTGITPDAIYAVLLASPCLWITEVDGVPAGFSMVDVEEGSVFAAFVRPEFESRGIGRRLVEQAEAFLLEQHDRLWLETGGQSRAAVFYRRLGWRLVGDRMGSDVRFEKRRAPPGAKLDRHHSGMTCSAP